MAPYAPELLPVGLLLEMAGALLMAAPDLPVLRQDMTAVELEEGRRRLLDMGTLDRADDQFQPVAAAVRENWDGSFDTEPAAFAFDDHPGRQRPMLCVLYDADPPDVANGVSIRTRLDNGSFDWVCDEPTFYRWLGERIVTAETQVKRVRGVGAVVLAVGASMQAVPYVIELVGTVL